MQLEKYLKKFLNSKNIADQYGNVYLTRYYVFRKPVWWLPSLYIHKFQRSDPDPELHNHPFDYSLSLILKGSYHEEYLDKDNCIKERIVKAGMFNYITSSKFHRIDLKNGDVWTLFLSGRKTKPWGFLDKDTREYADHTTHVTRKEIHKIILREI